MVVLVLESPPRLQNGNLKQKIAGADTPLLSSQILQLTPISADTDDLAVSAVPWHHLVWLLYALEDCKLSCNVLHEVSQMNVPCWDPLIVANCSMMMNLSEWLLHKSRLSVTAGEHHTQSQSRTLESCSCMMVEAGLLDQF